MVQTENRDKSHRIQPLCVSPFLYLTARSEMEECSFLACFEEFDKHYIGEITENRL